MYYGVFMCFAQEPSSCPQAWQCSLFSAAYLFQDIVCYGNVTQGVHNNLVFPVNVALRAFLISTLLPRVTGEMLILSV